MEGKSNLENEQGQVRSLSASINSQIQKENEEKLDQIQGELNTLKPLMEKIIEQNDARSRQADSVHLAPTSRAGVSDNSLV